MFAIKYLVVLVVKRVWSHPLTKVVRASVMFAASIRSQHFSKLHIFTHGVIENGHL